MTTIQLNGIPDKEISIGLIEVPENCLQILNEFNPHLVLVNACMIPTTTTVLAAVYKTLTERTHGHRITKSWETETVFNLAPSNNITSSLRIFGLAPSLKSDYSNKKCKITTKETNDNISSNNNDKNISKCNSSLISTDIVNYIGVFIIKIPDENSNPKNDLKIINDFISTIGDKIKEQGLNIAVYEPENWDNLLFNKICKWDEIKKVYKISQDTSKDDIEKLVISSIAIKGL